MISCCANHDLHFAFTFYLIDGFVTFANIRICNVSLKQSNHNFHFGFKIGPTFHLSVLTAGLTDASFTQ